MLENIIGILVSFAYFFGLLFLSIFIQKKNAELARKFVHIMLGNWWFILLKFFDSMIFALIVPASFIFINFFSMKKSGNVLSNLEQERKEKSYGIVLYPISLVLLIVISYALLKNPFAGGIGVMALAYGDGFAALVGNKLKFKPFCVFRNTKTVSGSLAMFFATFISILIYHVILSRFYFPNTLIVILAISIITTLVEAITPYGLDNLTIPVLAIFTYFVLMKLNIKILF